MTEPASTIVSEADLLRRYCQTGDEEAFNEIVQRYGGMVFGTCQRILRSRSLAEDVTQETFFRFVRQRSQVQSSLGGWLHRVATTLSIDAVRREQRRKRHEAAVPDAGGPAQPQASEWAHVSPMVDEALDELPEQTRMLLVERFLRGRTQAELASEQMLSPATVSRQIASGLEQLRGILRRKGVVVMIAPLLLWMTEQAKAGAVPQALARELGKIALVSGTAASGASASTGLTAASSAGATGKVAWKAARPTRITPWMATCGVSLVVIVSVLAMIKYGGLTDEPSPEPPPAKREPAYDSGNSRPSAIVVADFAQAGSQSLAAFTPPASPTDSVQCIYGDMRVIALPRNEADRLLKAQTGRDVAEWMAHGSVP